MGRKQQKKIPNLKAKRPSRRTDASAPVARLGIEGTKRLGADVPTSVYVQVEERCRDRGITKRDYILELLRGDGIR